VTKDMGLRERKREQTRQALAEAALDLFAERGYDATTVADIADRAGVSPRTFFTYHQSKEHVLFGEEDELLQSLTAHLDERPEGVTTLDALRSWLMGLVEAADPADYDSTRKQCLRDVVDRTPVLLAHQRQVLGRFEVVLRAAVAADLGEGPDDLRPRLVAATAAAALDATHPAEGKVYSLEESVVRLDAALAFLRGGLAALSQD
jgi:AcrR family transcriptional regulator